MSTGAGFLGFNMFAYCNNNPVMKVDSEGTRHEIFSGAGGIDIKNNVDPVDVITKIDNDVPPDHPNYDSPKKGDKKVKNPNGPGKGWEDSKGRVWVYTPNMHGGEGWTVQYPDGGHEHAYPGGHVRKATKETNPFSGSTKLFLGGVAVIVLLMDDSTGIGVSNDSLIPSAAAFALTGWGDIMGEYICMCGERW